MISVREVRQALRTKLLAGAVVAPTSIAWEGHAFDPTELAIWIEERVFPGDESTLTEPSTEMPMFVDYNVVTPAGSGSEASEDAVNAIKALFDIANTAKNTITLTSGAILQIDSIEQVPAETIDHWRYMGVRLTLTTING